MNHIQTPCISLKLMVDIVEIGYNLLCGMNMKMWLDYFHPQVSFRNAVLCPNSNAFPQLDGFSFVKFKKIEHFKRSITNKVRVCKME